MTAPWCIEFEEDVILVINDNVFVVMRHDDLDWTFLLLWNGLRLHASLDLAIDKVLNELADVIMGDFLLLAIRELGVFHSILNGKGRPFAILEIQIGRMGSKSFGVNGGEVHSSLVLLSEWLQSCC